MKYTKEQAMQIVRLCRYRVMPKAKRNKTYMRIKDIAAFLNKSYSYVYGICKELK